MKRITSNLLLSAALIACVIATSTASAQAQAPALGTAETYAILGTNVVATSGTVTCTDTGPGTSINGDVGTTFNTITNNGPCTITGSIDAPVAASVVTDFNAAYTSIDALNPACDGVIPTTTTTLAPGVYCSAAGTTIGAGVILTLDGTASDIWIFRVGTGGLGALTLTDAQVVMGSAALACNVYWKTAEAATLTRSNFVGTILSGAAITMSDGSWLGRALASTDVTVTDAAPLTFAGCASPNTITVNKDFIPNSVAPVSVSLTCTSGTVNNTPQNAAEGSPAVFTVGGANIGTTCTATETVPPGYTANQSNCVGVATGGSCTITNTLVGDPTLAPPTLSDYDTCDITTGTPAATLLLPYFEIDPSGLGENTLVTITNVSDTSIVAHVTVWTNWSYPVLDFNIFLTGYDVQSMSLRDLLVNGNIPNTARNTTTSPRGVRSTRSSTWIQAPYNTGMTPSCDSAQGGVGAIPGFLLPAIQSALTGGPYSVGAINCPQVADESDSYVGYITIDTTHVCSQSLPTDPGYFGAAGEIRHENLLIGDYVRLNDAEGYSGGNPLVHIAAIPGGDPALGATTLTSSFYQRYQAGFLTTDRRQPLPGLFAARYIEPGTAANFDTDFVVWREGVTTNAACQTISRNAAFPYVEIVRFDERENPTTTSFGCQVSPCLDEEYGLSETQLVNLSNPIFPPDSTSADPGGWMYMNLQHAEFITRPSQNWVQIRMTGAGVYGVDFDAAYLGNGCQSFVGETSLDDGAEKIGPKYVPGSEILWSGN